MIYGTLVNERFTYGLGETDIYFHWDCVAEHKASLKTFKHRFDTNIQFISPEYAGYYIVSTFQYYARERMQKYHAEHGSTTAIKG